MTNWKVHSKGRTGAAAMYHAHSDDLIIFINKNGAILFTPKTINKMGNPAYLQIASDDEGRIAFMPATQVTLDAYKVVKENAGTKTVSRITCMSFCKAMNIKPDNISRYDEVSIADGILIVEIASRVDL